MAIQEYGVVLKRAADGNTTTARVRSFSISLGSKSGDPSVGFNPAETLLAAAGGCITSSLTLVASNSGVEIRNLEVQVKGFRQDKPPRLISIDYELTVDSPDSDVRIDNIFRIAQKNSTVLSTLSGALKINGQWHR